MSHPSSRILQQLGGWRDAAASAWSSPRTTDPTPSMTPVKRASPGKAFVRHCPQVRIDMEAFGRDARLCSGNPRRTNLAGILRV